jgi:hypothetical protein
MGVYLHPVFKLKFNLNERTFAMERCFVLLMSICLLLAGCASPGKNKASDKPGDIPPPKLLAPSVRKIWMPPQLKDGGQEWEEGHFIYRIERGTLWSR